MKSGTYNDALGKRLKSEKAVLKPRGRSFRIAAIVVVSVAVVVAVYSW